jgi:ribonucleoside-diphosphate reductase alpha chain
VNDLIPDHHKMAGLNVKMSNLCSEITLPTGIDHLGNDRTAVCCLSSLNLENFDQWQDHPTFIEDIMRFLDNVLTDFIEQSAGLHEAREIFRDARAFGGLGRHGFPLLPAIENDPDGRRDGEGLEPPHVPAHQASGRRCLRQTRA